MKIFETELMLDSFSKFFNTVYINGWFFDPYDSLARVEIVGNRLIACKAEVGLDHGGVRETLGEKLGFSAQCLFDSDISYEAIELIFTTKAGQILRVQAKDLCEDRLSRYSTFSLSQEFFNVVNNAGAGQQLLDIGGRDRSSIDRRTLFPDAKVTVLDILPGENVDVVGDAHRLSEYLPASSFDFVLSVSVFEHLLMPWKAAIEIAKILKLGGIGYIHTHQTIGLHDAPWDFYRFSKYCWPALFNVHTGFEIIRSEMDVENFIIPFVLRPDKLDAERSAGCESSAVMIRKIGEPQVDWPVRLNEILSDMYPTS